MFNYSLIRRCSSPTTISMFSHSNLSVSSSSQSLRRHNSLSLIICPSPTSLTSASHPRSGSSRISRIFWKLHLVTLLCTIMMVMTLSIMYTIQIVPVDAVTNTPIPIIPIKAPGDSSSTSIHSRRPSRDSHQYVHYNLIDTTYI